MVVTAALFSDSSTQALPLPFPFPAPLNELAAYVVVLSTKADSRLKLALVLHNGQFTR
jgi:hypothetical protein